MTDTDIIKALGCLSGNVVFCADCGYTNDGRCKERVAKDALDLINRQKAEIERLKISTSICEYRDVLIDNATLVRINWENVFIQAVKSEAIREFAERLKEKASPYEVTTAYADDEEIKAVEISDIDNLVKEMTEGGNAQNNQKSR